MNPDADDVDDKASRYKARNAGKYGHRLWVGDETALMVEVFAWWPFFEVGGWFPSSWLKADDWAETWAYVLWSNAMRKKEKKREAQSTRAAEDTDLCERFPTLYDYLTAITYDGPDGGPRTVSTLLVFAADGVFKACLRDRDEGVCLWVAGRTFGDLLRVLEDELANDTGVWRLDRVAGHQVAARKPKPKSP